MLQSPGVWHGFSVFAANSVRLGQGRPFRTAFWPWSVRPTGSGKEGRSRASCFESPAGPPVMTEADGNLRARTVLPSAAPITSRCEPIPVFPLPPECILVRRVWLWNILRRVKHCGAHHGRFHSPRRFWTARVRRKGAGAHGTSPNGLTGESASADRRAGVVTKKHFLGQMLMLCA